MILLKQKSNIFRLSFFRDVSLPNDIEETLTDNSDDISLERLQMIRDVLKTMKLIKVI